jgi:hypothetical protein
MTRAGAALASYGLPSTHDLGSAASGSFGTLLMEAERHRTLGLLGAAVSDGVVTVDDDEHAEFEAVWRGWLGHCVRIEQLVLRSLTVLADAGIDARVLKGVALANTAYADPAWRVFGDADVLVPSRDFSRSAALLASTLGGVRGVPELRTGFDDRFGKEAMVRISGLELDLHRTFVEGAFGLTIDLDDLFAPPYRFPLAGFELAGLPMPQRLLHASYAAVLGDWPPRLMSLRDVAELVLRERPPLVEVLLMARRWRCEVVVAQAVVVAWRELQITTRAPIVEWAERYTPSRTERMLLASHEGPARAFTRHLAALFVLPDMATRLRYGRAIARPQPAYLRARGMTPVQHVKRAASRIVR